jgi:hypothetical protein
LAYSGLDTIYFTSESDVEINLDTILIVVFYYNDMAGQRNYIV